MAERRRKLGELRGNDMDLEGRRRRYSFWLAYEVDSHVDGYVEVLSRRHLVRSACVLPSEEEQ
jgi:hypothetical protein